MKSAHPLEKRDAVRACQEQEKHVYVWVCIYVCTRASNRFVPCAYSGLSIHGCTKLTAAPLPLPLLTKACNKRKNARTSSKAHVQPADPPFPLAQTFFRFVRLEPRLAAEARFPLFFNTKCIEYRSIEESIPSLIYAKPARVSVNNLNIPTSLFSL